MAVLSLFLLLSIYFSEEIRERITSRNGIYNDIQCMSYTLSRPVRSLLCVYIIIIILYYYYATSRVYIGTDRVCIVYRLVGLIRI